MEKNHLETNENGIVSKDNMRNGNEAQRKKESQEATRVRSLAEETNAENSCE